MYTPVSPSGCGPACMAAGGAATPVRTWRIGRLGGNMRRSYLLAFLMVFYVARPASAADRQKIRALNVGAQAIMTLISGAVQGHVRSPRDVARCLLAGSASGFGFYEAKSLIGRHHERTG